MDATGRHFSLLTRNQNRLESLLVVARQCQASKGGVPNFRRFLIPDKLAFMLHSTGRPVIVVSSAPSFIRLTFICGAQRWVELTLLS